MALPLFFMASACVRIWESELPGGAYNVVNPGYVSTLEVVELIKRLRRPEWEPLFWRDDNEFYQKGALARRSNCLLETVKLAQSGIKMRDVVTALADSIHQWKQAAAAR